VRAYIAEHARPETRNGEDMPEIQNWGWPHQTAARSGD
jgi:phosphoketolase